MKKILYLAAAALLTFGMVSCDNTNNKTTTTGDDTLLMESGWVNLGLPSGLLWYSVNIGATSPEEYGNYYAWGETQTRSDYSWSTYTYATVDTNGNLQTLTKYNTSSTYGTVDSKTTLESSDDVATQVLGNGARIPTKAEWQELLDNTTAEWTTVNGVYGGKYTATNGSSLFLPAASYRYGSELSYAGSYGLYWSASLDEDYPSGAWFMGFDSDYQYVNGSYRGFGFSVRAVRSQN